MKQKIDNHLFNSSQSSQSNLIRQQKNASKNDSLINNACNSKLLDQTDKFKLYDLPQDNVKESDSEAFKKSKNNSNKKINQNVNQNQDSFFYQDIMGLFPHGLALIDSTQTVIYNNPQILQLLECEKKDVIKTIASLSTQLSSHSQNQHQSFQNFVQISSNMNNGSLSQKANCGSSNLQYQQQSIHSSQQNVIKSKTNISQFAQRKQESNFDNILSSPLIIDEHSQEQVSPFYQSNKFITPFNQQNTNTNVNINIQNNNSMSPYQNNNVISNSHNNQINSAQLKHSYSKQNTQFGSTLNLPQSPSKQQQNGISSKNQIAIHSQIKKQYAGGRNGFVSIEMQSSFNEENLKNKENSPICDISKEKVDTGKFGNSSSEYSSNELQQQSQQVFKSIGFKEVQMKKRQFSLDSKALAQGNQVNLLLNSQPSSNFHQNPDNRRSQFCQSCLFVASNEYEDDQGSIHNSKQQEASQHFISAQLNFSNLYEMNQLNLNDGNKNKSMKQEKDDPEEVADSFINLQRSQYNLQNDQAQKKQESEKHHEQEKENDEEEKIQCCIRCQQLSTDCNLAKQKQNHLMKKELLKQNTFFSPQLKQRNVGVGQLLMNMFEGADDKSCSIKKSNSKNLIITQISECFESSFSRNQSLLGQINGNKNIGYYQYKDNMAAIQVLHKNKSLVVRLIPCEFKTPNQPKSNSNLVLIIVEPLWEELFQAKIEELSKSRMQLFGSLCHELRTPLNCSICFLDLYKQLKEGTQEEEDVNEFVEPSLRSNQLMLNMVNDILDFVQMTDNKFKFVPQKFNFEDLLSECLLMVKISAQIKKISLDIKKEVNIPQFITSDANRIRQVILNFLSNSLKFTQENGKIWIEVCNVQFISSQKQQCILKLSVHDTGIGISQANIRKIFELFYKTDSKYSSLNPNGCGIGLSLSNSLAKLIGPPISQSLNYPPGIQVESEEGKGSCFSFLIFDLTPFESHSSASPSNTIRESCNLTNQIEEESSFSERDSHKQANTTKDCTEPMTAKHSFQKIKEQIGVVQKREQTLPHLKIESETAGGLSIFHFQPAAITLPTSEKLNSIEPDITINLKDENTSIKSIGHQILSFGIVAPQINTQQTIPSSSIIGMKLTGQNDSHRKSRDSVKILQHQKLLQKKNFSLNSKGEPTKVLIVDDSAFNFIVMQKILALYQVTDLQCASNGGQAIQKVREVLGDENQRLFDIIFMDLEMPDISGYDACLQIKQLLTNFDKSADSIPIIACSAHGAQIKDENTFIISQLDDALSKPIVKSQIERVFEAFVYKPNQSQFRSSMFII